jgi:uncharacterized protein with FMN-binding domain
VKTRATVLGVLASIGVLAVGWEVGAAASQTTTSASGSSGSAGSSSAKNGTFTGSVESTQFGDVQVSVTIADGKITDVAALKLTDRESRSVEISDNAAPLLRAEVISAQSANVSTIGGATYTSEGYLTSLQSALDSAGF